MYMLEHVQKACSFCTIGSERVLSTDHIFFKVLCRLSEATFLITVLVFKYMHNVEEITGNT
jgi:hypothetical protein